MQKSFIIFAMLLLSKYQFQSQLAPNRLILAFLCLALFNAKIIAHTQPAELLPLKITAVVLNDMSPDSYIDTKNDKVCGFAVDFLNAIAENAKFKVEYLVVHDWKEVEDALRTGKADLCPILTITEARKKEFIFSKSVQAFYIKMAVRSENREIQDTSDLSNKAVGVIGASMAYQILKNKQNTEIIEYSSFKVAIFDLLAGRIDAFVAPEHNISKRKLKSR
jgi:ABC-type amino acid transport substrate-binding protein